MAGEFLYNISREDVAKSLSLLEEKCSKEDYWIVKLIKKELPDAPDRLLGYLSDIIEQELEIKKDEWFHAPDKSLEKEVKLSEIRKYAGVLREYEVNLDKLVISSKGKKYRVSGLVENAETLSAGLFETLYLLIKKEAKKIGIFRDIWKIRLESECGYLELEEGLISLDDEDQQK